MKFDITELLKKQRSTYKVQEQIQNCDGTYVGKDVKFLSPINVEGIFSRKEEQINFKGTIKAELLLNCSRCLGDFTYNLDIKLEENFTKKRDEQEDAIFLEVDIIEFDYIIFNAIDFALPIKKLCKEECNGLCSQCGTNLNTNTCLCSKINEDESEEDFVDTRFDKLKNLFKDK
ncbi:MAG: YceD family protein [Clostridium sp.]